MICFCTILSPWSINNEIQSGGRLGIVGGGKYSVNGVSSWMNTFNLPNSFSPSLNVIESSNSSPFVNVFNGNCTVDIKFAFEKDLLLYNEICSILSSKPLSNSGMRIVSSHSKK